MKVLVGMSGGIDSSVTVLMLQEAGHEVVGATMALWNKRDGVKPGSKNSCYSPNKEKDVEEARKICQLTGIPHYLLDCVEEYENIVLENFKREYISGRTPNPCVLCNSRIKFGAFPLLAEKSGIHFDKFATGHYARVVQDENTGRYLLKTAKDVKKDQSYFLYRLTQSQLSRVIFPLGEYTKDEIRTIARGKGLSISEKKDSQDFYCGDYSELLGVDRAEGNIVDKNGKILGKHNGFWNYTLGQRKGICISAPRPLYVIGLNKEKNEVIVGYEEDTFSKTLTAGSLNWILFEKLDKEMEVTAKIRSSQQPKNAVIRPQGENRVLVEFAEPQKAITPGQSVVFYSGDLVLGGGIID